MDLEHVSTEELATALASRTDLFESIVRPEDGLVNPRHWRLRTQLGTVGCVDGVAIRREGWVLYGGVIRRLTGRFPNKLAFIGGAVGLYESVEDAMKRHWKTDLGLDIVFPFGWEHPIPRQYAPQVDDKNRPGFYHDPGKHSYAQTHIVQIVGEGTVVLGEGIGGQEAAGLEWYTFRTCPPGEEWSYDMRDTFLKALARVEVLEKLGRIGTDAASW